MTIEVMQAKYYSEVYRDEDWTPRVKMKGGSGAIVVRVDSLAEYRRALSLLRLQQRKKP